MSFSQESDTIKFVYPKDIYRSIAKDSVKKLYDKQYNYFNKIKEDYDTSRLLSFNTKFEELDYYSIPMYRLYREGFEKYDCSKNIEDFIVFNEYNKYQTIIITRNKVVVSTVRVPNNLIEMNRIYTPDVFTTYAMNNYVQNYLESLEKYKKNNFYYRILNTNNFFFKIFGLDDVIFEIDKETGILYANGYHEETYGKIEGRLPANDFLRKHIGEKVIKELCLGHYLEIDHSINSEYYKPCEDLKKSNVQKHLKVTTK